VPSPSFSDITRMLDEVTVRGDPAAAAVKKRLRIVKAAAEVFLQHGYRKASVDAIAQRAGLAKGTVYLYFKSKADLLVFALGAEKRQYVEALRPIFSPEVDPEQRIAEYLRQALPLLLRMPLTCKLLRGDREVSAVFEELDADVSAHYHAMQTEFMTRLLEPFAPLHGWSAGEVEERARVLIALLYASGVLVDEHVRAGLSAERFGELFSSLIVDGLRAPPTASSSHRGPQ
jgi:AcrR family transcriptional regulator